MLLNRLYGLKLHEKGIEMNYFLIGMCAISIGMESLQLQGAAMPREEEVAARAREKVLKDKTDREMQRKQQGLLPGQQNASVEQARPLVQVGVKTADQKRSEEMAKARAAREAKHQEHLRQSAQPMADIKSDEKKAAPIEQRRVEDLLERIPEVLKKQSKTSSVQSFLVDQDIEPWLLEATSLYRQVHQINSNSSVVGSVAMSADGNHMVVGYDDGIASILERRADGTWAQVSQIRYGKKVDSVAMSADGSRIAMGSFSTSLATIFELQNNGSWMGVHTIGHNERVNSVAMNDNGTRVAIGFNYDKTVRIAERQADGTWKSVHYITYKDFDINSDIEYEDVDINSVAMSADGTYLAVILDGEDEAAPIIECRAENTWVKVHQIDQDVRIYKIAMNATGSRIAVGYEAGRVNIIRRQPNGEWIPAVLIDSGIEEDEGNSVSSLAMNREGNRLVVGYFSGAAALLELQPDGSWERVFQFEGGEDDEVYNISVAMSGDGNRVLIQSFDDTVHILERIDTRVPVDMDVVAESLKELDADQYLFVKQLYEAQQQGVRGIALSEKQAKIFMSLPKDLRMLLKQKYNLTTEARAAQIRAKRKKEMELKKEEPKKRKGPDDKDDASASLKKQKKQESPAYDFKNIFGEIQAINGLIDEYDTMNNQDFLRVAQKRNADLNKTLKEMHREMPQAIINALRGIEKRLFEARSKLVQHGTKPK